MMFPVLFSRPKGQQQMFLEPKPPANQEAKVNYKILH